MNNKLAISEGKTMAVISYLTWIGTLIAYIMNNSKKNHFVSFHIRQMIGLILLNIVSFTILGLNGLLGRVTTIIIFILWLIGFIGAINGEYKKVPFLGDKFQEWFKKI